MQSGVKSLKEYCKEARKRLKSGFWQTYRQDLNEKLQSAKSHGVSQSKVKEYYTQKVTEELKNPKTDDENFYLQVKFILDNEGEVSDVLGRLTDKDYFNSLSYEEKQRYSLSLSERYLKAVERYNREKLINC